MLLNGGIAGGGLTGKNEDRELGLRTYWGSRRLQSRAQRRVRRAPSLAQPMWGAAILIPVERWTDRYIRSGMEDRWALDSIRAKGPATSVPT